MTRPYSQQIQLFSLNPPTYEDMYYYCPIIAGRPTRPTCSDGHWHERLNCTERFDGDGQRSSVVGGKDLVLVEEVRTQGLIFEKHHVVYYTTAAQ
jgi:hypothetical protein